MLGTSEFYELMSAFERSKSASEGFRFAIFQIEY